MTEISPDFTAGIAQELKAKYLDFFREMIDLAVKDGSARIMLNDSTFLEVYVDPQNEYGQPVLRWRALDRDNFSTWHTPPA